MSSRTIACALIAAAAVWAVNVASGEEKSGDMALKVHDPASLKWQDGPPSLPAGAKFTVLDGDPTKEGPFVMRLKFPDGYRVPPHTHPKPERLTIIAGTLNLGSGDTFDASKGMPLPTGSFAAMPQGMKHYAWAKGESIVQLHGEGPWRIDYVNPADDPRKKK